MDGKIAACINELNSLPKTIHTLELKVDALEDHSRRSNLMIYGVLENEKESEGSLADIINETIIEDILKMEPVTFERIHRLGKPAPKKHDW